MDADLPTYVPTSLLRNAATIGNAEGGHRLLAVAPFSLLDVAYLRGALAFPSGPASSSSERKRSSAPE